MLEIAIKAAGRNVTLGDLPSILGARRAYAEIGDMIEALIAQLDMLAGDSDLEEIGAEDGFAVPPHQLGWDYAPGCPIADPGGQCDEDEISTCLAVASGHGPGCKMSDEGGTDAYEHVHLSYSENQSEPEPFDPATDREIMRAHRDFIRGTRCDTYSDPTWGNQIYIIKRPLARPVFATR